MGRLYYILFVFLLFFEARAQGQGASGGVVVHAPRGLDVLFKKSTPPKARIKNVQKPALPPIGPAPGAASAAAQPPKPAGTANANKTPAPPNIPAAHVHLVSDEKQARVVYSGKGFRVQVYYGPDRTRAVKIKTQFTRSYPGLRTYLTYSPPYFRVRIGNYRYREDAQGMLREANSMYSPSMIVPDIITISTF